MGGGGGGGSEPDLLATFGHANACFSNWGRTAPIVIFWLTP